MGGLNEEQTAHFTSLKLIVILIHDRRASSPPSRETVNSNSTLEKSLNITPLLANNKEKRGLSVDGRLKDEDTHLASTTL